MAVHTDDALIKLPSVGITLSTTNATTSAKRSGRQNKQDRSSQVTFVANLRVCCKTVLWRNFVAAVIPKETIIARTQIVQ
jgi:hypothetical protein